MNNTNLQNNNTICTTVCKAICGNLNYCVPLCKTDCDVIQSDSIDLIAILIISFGFIFVASFIVTFIIVVWYYKIKLAATPALTPAGN